jgi:hypothetical protein
MEGNLNYIDELGMGEPTSENTEPQETKDNQVTEETQDLTLESDTTEVTENETQENTESNELDELRKQIEGLEKRVSDKDDYIKELREASKQKEAEGSKEEVVDEEDDFWEDPVKKYKELQGQIQMQQMLIAETQFANTVNDYWKTVNPDALKEAVATDAEFSDKFNSSKEPYKVAYEYLSAKSTEKIKSEEALRESIRKELLAEMGKDKPKKETVPSTTNISGNSGNSKNSAPTDGFASMYGSY